MISPYEILVNSLQIIANNNSCRKYIKFQCFITQTTMKKIMIKIPIIFVIAVIFGAILSSYIGILESVYAQTNATNTTKANNTTTAADVGSASDLENLTRDNAGSSQNRGDIATPSIGVMGGLEKEQIIDTEGNMTAADKTAGRNVTTTGNGSSSSNVNTTTTANNTSANQTSSENKTGNPLSNVPIIGELFK
jgi:hypothetical protein